jgi:cysteine-rich repeat protein
MARSAVKARWRRLLTSLAALGVVAIAAGSGCGGDVPTNYLSRPAQSSGGAAAGAADGNAGSKAQDAGQGGGEDTSGGGQAGAEIAGGGSSSQSSGGSVSSGGGLVGGGTAGSGASTGQAGSENDEPCGNDEPDDGEECDDGNVLDGDGCSSICTSSCESCETWYFEQEEVSDCGLGPYCLDGLGPEDVASAGPAGGVARNLLCQSLLACIRRSNCAADPSGETPPGGFNCYCGDSFTGGDCSSPAGACKQEIEWAAESEEYSTILTRFQNYDYAVGRAMALIGLCDAVYCQDACFEEAAWTEPGAGGAGP